MAAHYTKIEPFDVEKGDFSYYIQRFKHFLDLNVESPDEFTRVLCIQGGPDL